MLLLFMAQMILTREQHYLAKRTRMRCRCRQRKWGGLGWPAKPSRVIRGGARESECQRQRAVGRRGPGGDARRSATGGPGAQQAFGCSAGARRVQLEKSAGRVRTTARSRRRRRSCCRSGARTAKGGWSSSGFGRTAKWHKRLAVPRQEVKALGTVNLRGEALHKAASSHPGPKGQRGHVC